MIYLDTHVAAWLYAGRTALIPVAVRSLLDGDDLLVSPMVSLELGYLHEVGRVTEPAALVLDALSRAMGLRVCDLLFPRVVQVALAHSWTRDPFDRLIVAQAELRGAPLVTKDQTIRDHFPLAVWG